MLRFFRRIRHRLLTHNKFSSYLLYAIGEVLLVMLGILLALQVNNWNEARKTRKQETEILRQLRADFQRNLEQLDQKISAKTEIVHSSLRLFKYIDFPELRHKDSVDYHIGRTIPFTTFDPVVNDIFSSGELRIISNDSLRRRLAYWTSEIADVREDDLSWKEYRDNFYDPFLIAHYQLRTVRNSANKTQVLQQYLIEEHPGADPPDIGVSKHPEDFNALLNHPDYEDHLERCLTKNVHALNQYTILRANILTILNLLNSEISKVM